MIKQKPCFMPGATEYLECILNKDMVVFEWGSGASTQWFADRVKFIYSVEHQQEWFDKTSQYLTGYDNTLLIHKQLDPIEYYINAIEEIGGKFDLIVIDGRHRVGCLKEALKHKKLEGFILFDDIERMRYLEARKLLLNYPFRHFVGSFHKNCKWDDDPSGITQQITAIYYMQKDW